MWFVVLLLTAKCAHINRQPILCHKKVIPYGKAKKTMATEIRVLQSSPSVIKMCYLGRRLVSSV